MNDNQLKPAVAWRPTWAVLLYVVAAMSAGGCASVRAFPGDVTQLIGLGGALGFLFTVGAGLFHLAKFWSQLRLLAALPLLVASVLAWSSPRAGPPIAQWWFNNVRLKYYEVAVAWIDSQPLSIAESVDPKWSPPRIQLPPQYASLAYITEAHRHSDGSLVVVFAYSGAFPVKHFAYIYSSSGAWDHHLDHEWHGVRLAPKWFSVAD